MKHLAIVVLVIACLPSYIHSQKETVTITNGFLTGKEYLDLDNNDKRHYGMGVVNGMLAAPFFGAPEAKTKWLGACIRNMNDEQVAAILTKYVRENPAKWHYGMVTLSFNAMSAACEQHRR